MSAVFYGLVGVIVVLLLVIGYLYLFPVSKGTEEVESNCATSNTCTYDKTTCSSFAANDSTCTALGYSKTASTSASITTTSPYCKGLSANIALFASNVVSYYTVNTVVKKTTSSGASTVINIYEGQTNPNFATTSAVTAWAKSSNDVTKSLTSDVTSIKTSSKADTLFAGAPSILTNLELTMNTMFGLAAAPSGSTYTAPTTIWKNQLTDSDNNVWSTLDTSQLAAAVTDALEKLSGDYLMYC